MLVPESVREFFRCKVLRPLLRQLRGGVTPRRMAWSLALGMVIGINPSIGLTMWTPGGVLFSEIGTCADVDAPSGSVAVSVATIAVGAVTGVLDAASIIERRPLTRQLRIGTNRIRLDR